MDFTKMCKEYFKHIYNGVLSAHWLLIKISCLHLLISVRLSSKEVTELFQVSQKFHDSLLLYNPGKIQNQSGCNYIQKEDHLECWKTI